MKLSSLHRLLWTSLPALVCMPLLSLLPMTRVQAASGAATSLPGARNPLVRLRSPQTVKIDYTGSPDAVAALEGGRATPTALAQADFNGDGAPDVVAGYATGDGGVLTVLLGNRDAFAPTDPALFQKALRGDVAATFVGSAKAYALFESPDMIVTGDFNRDGHQDVLVASRGGTLYLLAGDGKGGLGTPKPISAAGIVWAMAATGDGHLAVSTEGGQGPEVRILAPIAGGLSVSARFALPVQGDVVLWADLGGGNDLAVGAGSRIAVIYHPLSANARTESVDVPFKVEGLTAGDFIWDRDGRTEIAALANDGSVHILAHGTLDSRPLTPEDIPGRRAAMMQKRKLERSDPTSIGAWTIAGKLPVTASAPSRPAGPSAFSASRLAAASTQALMVVDGGRSQLSILDTSGRAESPSAGVSFAGGPVAALTLRQKINARRDTVVLTAGHAELTILPEDGGAIDPAVTTTADTDPQGACAQDSAVNVGNLTGTVSLRTAVCAVNNSGAGNYTITVPAGTYSLSGIFFGGNSSPNSSGELQVGMASGENITISGAGAGSTIIQQTDSVDRVIEQDQAGQSGIPLTIQNLTVTGGICTSGLDCAFSGGGILAGYYAGDSLTLTSVTVSNNSEQADTPALGGGNQGGGVSMAGPDLNIANSTFSSNSVTSSAQDSGYGGGIEFLDDQAGSLTITGSTFTSNTVPASTLGAQGAGLWISLSSGGDTASITGSVFTGNQAQGSNGEGGAIYADGPTTVTGSRIVGNEGSAGGSGLWAQGGASTVTENWWGCNARPGLLGCDTVNASGVSGDNASVNYTPWLVLTFNANPTTLALGGTSALTASIDTDSNGGTGFNVPDGTAVTFSGGTVGSVNPSSTTTSSGVATSTFTAGSSGTGNVSAMVDNQALNVNMSIAGPPNLAVVKSHTGNFTQGSQGVWTINVYNTAGAAIDATTGATVTMIDSLPTGYTMASYTGTGWTCSGSNTVTCTSTAVVAGASGSFPSILLTANVPSNSPTSVVNNVVVYGGGDPNHTNSGNGATAFDTVTVNLDTYLLTTVANPSAGGTVSPGSGQQLIGSVVPISATANAGYTFIGWTSSPGSVANSTAASTTITMNAAETVTANFGANLVVTTATDDAAGVAGNCTPQTTPGSNTTDSACSLRDALTFAANAGAASITFASAPGQLFSSAQTITLIIGPGTLNIPSNTSITGPTSGSGYGLTNLVTVNGGGQPVGVPVFTGSATGGGSSIANLIITNGITTAVEAGGIYNNGSSTLTITNCTVSGNDAPEASGGIYNDGGTMTVVNSTVSGNSGAAGGLSNGAGPLTVIGTTLTGNTGTAVGGGLYIFGGSMTVTNSTVSGNTSDANGGGIDINGGTVSLANTIVSGNTAPLDPDIDGTPTDLGGNQVSTAVDLSALGSYGGPTKTMVPMPGSLAICAGTSTNVTAAGITTDQRGFVFDPRCASGSVDSGAVQSNYALQFSNVPHTTVAGQVITPAPTTTLFESGVISTTPTTAVTLSDASSTLSGTTTENLSSGVATFPNVSFTTAGLNTQLIATMALNSTTNLVATAGTTTTVSPVPAVLASPSPSSTLTGPVITFSWSAVSAASGYSLWIGSSGPGSNNLYVSHEITALSARATGLPTDGSTIYVRLYTIFDGVATPNDYTFTASTRAALTAPSSPSTFTSPNVSFSWSQANGAVGYSLWLGSTGIGSNNLYDSGNITALTATANGLPTNGETIYARINTIYSGGVSVSNDYTYTAATAPMAQLTTPTPSTTLSGSTVTFTWTAGTGASGYTLWIGSTAPGSNNLYVSHETSALSATATNLPTNGSTVYVRLYTIYNGTSKYTDYTYTAAP